MGGEIATAFVRIRPKIGTEFKSETESGVRGAFSKIAKVVGVALGARAAYEIAKSSVDAAALIQKQIEVVRAEFGAAGKSLIDFANEAGTALGGVNTDTLAASARFGILFKNLGLGPRLAAQMTQGFEKLALATNAIRGGSTADAAQLLQVLAKGAATGRGLNQLGISVSAAQEQIVAFKLGLISTTKQALTPAQKAIAIYAIATRNLGGILQQAKSHENDFADVQAKLTAEWAKAKEMLGAALLPEIKKAVTAFSGWLNRMEKSGKLQRDFNAAGRIAGQIIKGIVTVVHVAVGLWNAFSSAVGGTKNAVVIFLAVAAVSKFAAITKSVVGLAKTFTGPLKTAMNIAKVGWAIMTGTMTAETEALAVTIKASLISTGIGALVVAIGIAAAYIFTHWDQVKRWTVALGHVMVQIWRGVKNILVGYYEFIGASIVKFLIFPMKEFIDVAAKATGWIPFVGDGVSAAAHAVDSLYESVSRFADSGKEKLVRGFGDLNPSKLGKAWSDSMKQTANDPTTKKAARDAGKTLADGMSQGAQQAVSGIAPMLQKKISETVLNAIKAAHQAIADSVRSAKDNLEKIGQDLARTIEKIQAKMGGAAGALAGSPQGQAFQKLKKLIESGAPSFEIARARSALVTQLQGVGKEQKSSAQKQLANLTSAFNQGKITYAQFTERLHKILRENGITMAKALKVGGSAFANVYRAQVEALQKQARAIAAVPAKFRGIGGAGGAADIKIVEPLNVIKAEQAKIRAAIAKAATHAHTDAHKQIATLAQIRAKLEIHHARRRARDEGPPGPLGPVRAPRRRRDEGPPGPLGPVGVPDSVRHLVRSVNDLTKNLTKIQREGPPGPRGPIGVPIHEAVIRHVGDQVRAGADRTKEAITTQRAAVVAAITGLRHQSNANDHAILRGELRIVHPLERLRSDQSRATTHASQQRERMIRSSDRTNSLLRGIVHRTDPPLPGYGKQPKGKGSHDARAAANVGSRG